MEEQGVLTSDAGVEIQFDVNKNPSSSDNEIVISSSCVTTTETFALFPPTDEIFLSAKEALSLETSNLDDITTSFNDTAGTVTELSRISQQEMQNLSSEMLTPRKNVSVADANTNENEAHCASLVDRMPSEMDRKSLLVPMGFTLPQNEEPVKEEEFQDAVQFFKNPADFDFLRTAGRRNPQPSVPRSSLYVTFDPLLSGQGDSQYIPKMTVTPADAVTDAGGDVKPMVSIAEETGMLIETVEEEVAPNPAVDELVANTLISFDSPVKIKKELCVSVSTPPKMYTEENVSQALKIQELNQNETRLREQQESAKRMTEVFGLCNALHATASSQAETIQDLYKKCLFMESENTKLKQDLKTSTEDLQNVESAFADFHKRYESSRGIIIKYKQNEENLRLQIRDLEADLEDHNRKYDALKNRTEELLGNANNEVTSIKKSSDSQNVVLHAQLKKAELKISNLESDNRQLQVQNERLNEICDDLMAKVSNPNE